MYRLIRHPRGGRELCDMRQIIRYIPRLFSELCMNRIFESSMFPYFCTTRWEFELNTIQRGSILPNEDDLIIYRNRKYRYNTEYLFLISLYYFIWSSSPIWMYE